jgi:hypothetical protein
VLFSAVAFAAKEVRNEPVKKRLFSEALEVMEKTSPPSPMKPLNGGADQELDLVSHIATDEPGDVK